MNEDKEKISAWLDDAIGPDELETLQIGEERGRNSTTVRYRMIGDAVRGRVVDASMIDVSAAVREAINREPLPVATQSPARAARRSDGRAFGLASWLRPVGGLAVAATVAMVMVVTLTDQQTPAGKAVVANVDQQPVEATPVGNLAPGYGQPALALPAVNLNNYVTEHSEYAAQETMQGMMPYARAVSYGAEKHPSVQRPAPDDQTVNTPGK